MRIIYCLVIGGLIAVLASLGLESSCPSTSYPEPKLIGVWEPSIPSVLGDFVVKREIVFLLQGLSPVSRLVSIDVSDPAHPQEVGSVELLGFSYADITIKENYVFTVSSSSGYLEIFDISTPQSPQRVGSLNSHTSITAIGIKENVAYIYSDWEPREILVIDISDPTKPKLIRSVIVRQDFPVFNIHIYGNFAFLANSSAGISVLDIEQPLEPVFLSSFNPNEGLVYDVKTKGEFVYFPQTHGIQSDFSELFVVDASNASQMELVSSTEIGRRETLAKGIALNGRIAAIGIQAVPVSKVLLVDISDPTSPEEKGSADIPSELETTQGEIFIQDGLIFISAVRGLAIYEIVYR